MVCRHCSRSKPRHLAGAYGLTLDPRSAEYGIARVRARPYVVAAAPGRGAL